MSERIKLSGSIGRGVHYLKKLARCDGQPSNTYKLETELQIQVIQKERDIGQTLKVVDVVIPAGGPILKVGDYLEDLNSTIKYIDIDNVGNILITTTDDSKE